MESISFTRRMEQAKRLWLNMINTVKTSFSCCLSLSLDLGVYYAGAWGVTIGQLTPKNNFQQWLVENSATEEDVRDTVIDMVNLIEAYAVPFLNKYSDINEILFELEEGNRLVPRYAGYNLPLLYYMLGEKENAISYINQELTKKESQAKRSHEGSRNHRLKKV